MATILFTWELGAGIGHLMGIAPLAKPLAALGHQVYLAAKDLAAAKTVFGDDPTIQCLQAPPRAAVTWKRFDPIYSFAHLLHNIGFGDDEYLAITTNAWKDLYLTIDPDLIVFEHSPTALLAARGQRGKRALLGSGFSIPPDVRPLPNLRTVLSIDVAQLQADEDEVLQCVNTLLRSWDQPALDHLAQLFSQVDETFLTTYPQLDQYPNRGSARYYGPVNSGSEGGILPTWPDAPGKRIYVYVREFTAMGHLMQVLQNAGLPTLIYADGIPFPVQQRFASPAMQFEMQRPNMQQAAERCDIAITTATLGTVSMMLRAGKPQLLLPQTLEQGLVARRMSELGAGISVLPKQIAQTESALRELLSNDRYAQAALNASKILCEVDLAEQQQEILRRLERLSDR